MPCFFLRRSTVNILAEQLLPWASMNFNESEVCWWSNQGEKLLSHASAMYCLEERFLTNLFMIFRNPKAMQEVKDKCRKTSRVRRQKLHRDGLWIDGLEYFRVSRQLTFHDWCFQWSPTQICISPVRGLPYRVSDSWIPSLRCDHSILRYLPCQAYHAMTARQLGLQVLAIPSTLP